MKNLKLPAYISGDFPLAYVLSSRFRIEELESFLEDMLKYDVNVIPFEEPEEDSPTYLVQIERCEAGGWPGLEGELGHFDVDFCRNVQSHLSSGEICVLRQVYIDPNGIIGEMHSITIPAEGVIHGQDVERMYDRQLKASLDVGDDEELLPYDIEGFVSPRVLEVSAAYLSNRDKNDFTIECRGDDSSNPFVLIKRNASGWLVSLSQFVNLTLEKSAEWPTDDVEEWFKNHRVHLLDLMVYAVGEQFTHIRFIKDGPLVSGISVVETLTS